MPPLRRHQLAFPAPAGWHDILARDWDAELRAGLAHWAQHQLPLVVTRQRVPRSSAAAPISLGLSLPQRWGRRLVALQLLPAQLLMFAEFPALADVLLQLPSAARPALQQAAAALGALGLRARVYGSVGWQAVTGLRYVHQGSDLDLWLAVDSAAEADAAAVLLHQCAPQGLRIDGELVFTDGSATAWREWRAWRAGQCRSLLVKHLDGASMQQQPPGAPTTPAPVATA